MNVKQENLAKKNFVELKTQKLMYVTGGHGDAMSNLSFSLQIGPQ